MSRYDIPQGWPPLETKRTSIVSVLSSRHKQLLMTNRWEPERTLGADEAQRWIETQFPELGSLEVTGADPLKELVTTVYGHDTKTTHYFG